MTTRPGYIWSGSEWIPLWQEANTAPVSYQDSAPTSPATGDIWIDSDENIPSVDNSLLLRWTKTMSGGETSISGADDNGLPLTYTPNYEEVYINGVLQTRGSDYVATTGTTLTGLTALSANDIVSVQSIAAYSVGDAYTKAETTGLLSAYSPVTTTGLVLINSTTFTSASTVTINNCFSSSYENYRIIFKINNTATSDTALVLRSSGNNSTSGYRYAHMYVNGGQGLGANTVTNPFYSLVDYTNSSANNTFAVDIYNPFLSVYTTFSNNVDFRPGDNYLILNGGRHEVNSSYDGFHLYSFNGGTMTGSVKIYGYK